MTRKIQVLIRDLEKKKSYAISMASSYEDYRKWYSADMEKQKAEAYDFCIQQLTLILNSENENGGKKDGQMAANR